MRSFTCPPEACSQRWAISLRSSCQVEPWGARVPSLMVTGWAWAAGASAASRAARTSFFTGDLSGSEEQVVDVVQQRAGAALGQDVGEPVAGLELGIGAQDLLEDARELGPVLPLDQHALGPCDARA